MDSPVGDRLCFFSSLSIQAWPRALRCEQEKHSLLSDVNYCLERRSILHPADRVSAIRCDFFSRLSERTVRARVLLFYHTASLGWKLGRRLDLREKANIYKETRGHPVTLRAPTLSQPLDSLN